jgi:hypothetical protein
MADAARRAHDTMQGSDFVPTITNKVIFHKEQFDG